MPNPCFPPGCAMMEARPLAFAPPGIRGSSLRHLGKTPRGSRCPSIQAAALQAEPAGCQGAGGCEKSPVPRSLGFSGLVRGAAGAGDAPASSQEGPPGSPLVPGGCAAHKRQEARGWGAVAVPRWGFVGKRLRGCWLRRCRDRNRNSELSAGLICLKSAHPGFRLSPTPTLWMR